VTTPIFWLGLSIVLVAVCLTVVLAVAIPAFQELARAARSAEKLFDTLSKDLPPTLEALRLTGLEARDLTDNLGESLKSAGRVVQQVDHNLQGAKQQVREAEITSRSLFAGAKAAVKTLTTPKQTPSPRRSDRHTPSPEPSPREPQDSMEPPAQDQGSAAVNENATAIDAAVTDDSIATETDSSIA
jgi:hypothetical protein